MLAISLIYTLSLSQNLLYQPSPYEYDYSHFKTTSLFVMSDKGQVHQVDISSSLGELAPSSSLASSVLEPSSLSSSDISGEGEKVAVKPPMVACCYAIRPHGCSLDITHH